MGLPSIESRQFCSQADVKEFRLVENHQLGCLNLTIPVDKSEIEFRQFCSQADVKEFRLVENHQLGCLNLTIPVDKSEVVRA